MQKYLKQWVHSELAAQELSLMELKGTVSSALLWVASCSEKASLGRFVVQSPERLIPSSYFAQLISTVKQWWNIYLTETKEI